MHKNVICPEHGVYQNNVKFVWGSLKDNIVLKSQKEFNVHLCIVIFYKKKKRFKSGLHSREA